MPIIFQYGTKIVCAGGGYHVKYNVLLTLFYMGVKTPPLEKKLNYAKCLGNKI